MGEENHTTPAATHLLQQHHSGSSSVDSGAPTELCCFCGIARADISTDEATSAKYFSDDDLLDVPESDRVCSACAYCMSQRSLKQGHWLVHADGLELPSTGELLGHFRRLRDGQYNPPLAIHVTSSPIRSSHAYLWTPVNETHRPLTIAFDRQSVRVTDWDAFERLLAVIEDLRLCGFTFAEIRSGEPRIRNLRDIGRDGYEARDAVLDPHRRTARLELALTLSRSADDQPRTDYTTDHQPLTIH